MADYFSRLLDRARGDAPLLERRTPQPFEPPASVGAWAGDGPALGRVDTEAEAVEERAVTPTRDGIRPLAPHSHPRAETFRAADRPVPAQPRTPDDAATLNATVISVERRDERRVAAEVQVDASLGRAPGDAPLTVARATREEMSRPTDLPVSMAPRRDESPAVHAERQASTSRASQVNDAPTRVVRAAPIADAPQPSASGAAHETQPAFAPVAPRIAAAPIASTERPPAPTIHVSIGRVEVRAVPAQPSARTQSADQRGPRLSLDAYLRSRAGDAT